MFRLFAVPKVFNLSIMSGVFVFTSSLAALRFRERVLQILRRVKVRIVRFLSTILAVDHLSIFSQVLDGSKAFSSRRFPLHQTTYLGVAMSTYMVSNLVDDKLLFATRPLISPGRCTRMDSVGQSKLRMVFFGS